MKVIMIFLCVWMANTKIHRAQFIPNRITAVTIVWLVDWNTAKSKANNTSSGTLSDTIFLGEKNSCLGQTETVVLFGN